MSLPVYFHYDRLAVSRWRNGGGETRQIASLPTDDDAEAFAWRASIATIEQQGPFSRFPATDRIITLLSGDGVKLERTDTGSSHALTVVGEPWEFDGEWPIDTTLLGGTSLDFNIMTRRPAWQAKVRAASSLQLLTAGHSGVVYVLKGSWRYDIVGQEGLPKVNGSRVLGPEEGLWWHLSNQYASLVPQDEHCLALWADIFPAAR